jgi:hypothetical protein
MTRKLAELRLYGTRIAGKGRVTGVVVLVGAFAVGFVLTALRVGQAGPERWFIPGELGHVNGVGGFFPSGRRYLTRSLGLGTTAVERVWQEHNGLGPTLSFSHHLSAVFTTSVFEVHPEYFPLVEGRRLRPSKDGPVSWNPDLGRDDVAKFAAQAARRFFMANSPADSFALGINDGLTFGESPETLALTSRPQKDPASMAGEPRAWFRNRPNYSNLVFTFMNRAAADLASTHPTKLLGALAYYWAEDAPDFPVHPQVVPYLTADRSQGYDRGFRDEERALQARWASAGPKRLGLYDYLYGKGFIIPRYHPHLLAANLRQARRLGFTDYYAEMTPNWGLDGPQPWLVAQLLLDPEIPVDSLLDEYFSRYFKESGAPMRRFFDGCERQWLNQGGTAYWLKHYRNESQAAIFPSQVCQRLRRELLEAEQLASSAVVKARVKLVSEAFGATERFVAFQEARASLTAAALKDELAGAVGLKQLQAYREARAAFITQVVALRHQEPLALYPSDFQDFLVNDPLFEATTALLNTTSREHPTAVNAILAELKALPVPRVEAAVKAWERRAQLVARADFTFAGTLKPARQIAGLTYGVALPAPWHSRVEPYQTHTATWPESGRVLRIAGSKDTAVYQWVPAQPGKVHCASVRLRGHLSPSAIATLTLGWLDKDQHHLGLTVARLPEGDWPHWSQLLQGAVAPANAAWVGVGVRVQHQAKDDWIEVESPSLSVER